MKKQLLKIINFFVIANIIFFNRTVTTNAAPKSAYEIRQKTNANFEKERKGEEGTYKYLAQQLCIYFNPPKFPDEELTFNTPFGNVKLTINSTRSIFITTGINTYNEIGQKLDNFLTKDGRKHLAKIILKYLQTNPDEEYKTKSFNKYEFKNYANFFGLKNKSCFQLKTKDKSYRSKVHELEKLNKKIEELNQTAQKDLRSIKDDNSKKQIMNARDDLKNSNIDKKNIESEISNIEKRDTEKLEKAKNAANALCAILMIAEPNYTRSFDGGKHERALIRDVISGTTYTKAFEKFVPNKDGGATLAYEYSTSQDKPKVIFESDCYSDDDDENNFEEDGCAISNLFEITN